MFAQLVEAEVHQFDRIDRVLAIPRINRAMRRLAVERELGADRGIVLQAKAGGEIVADVNDQRGIDILEIARAHEERTADELFFRRPERNDDRAGQLVALHDLLHREGRAGGDAAVGVMALHVPRPSRDDWLACN